MIEAREAREAIGGPKYTPGCAHTRAAPKRFGFLTTSIHDSVQRLGFCPIGPRRSFWVHAPVVGDVIQVAPLVHSLRAHGETVVVSTTTTRARFLALQRFDQGAFMLPFDRASCMGRAVRRLSPRAIVLMDMELWPSLLNVARQHRVPIILVNGSFSDHQFRGFLAHKLRPRLKDLAAVLAVSDKDRDRFLMMGCPPSKCEVVGHIRYAALEETAPPPDAWQRRVIVAGSLHDGEIDLWIDMLRKITGPSILHVVAPRFIGRIRAIARRFRSAQVPYVLWSRCSPNLPQQSQANVLLVDTVGDLPKLYAAATLAFVGGSLVPAGGHNLLEPAILGRPVLFGSSTYNQAEAADLLLGEFGGLRVTSAEQLAACINRLLQRPEEANAMGVRAARVARRFHAHSRKALSTTVDRILTLECANGHPRTAS